jgi:hypothetical protein
MPFPFSRRPHRRTPTTVGAHPAPSHSNHNHSSGTGSQGRRQVSSAHSQHRRETAVGCRRRPFEPVLRRDLRLRCSGWREVARRAVRASKSLATAKSRAAARAASRRCRSGARLRVRVAALLRSETHDRPKSATGNAARQNTTRDRGSIHLSIAHRRAFAAAPGRLCRHPAGPPPMPGSASSTRLGASRDRSRRRRAGRMHEPPPWDWKSAQVKVVTAARRSMHGGLREPAAVKYGHLTAGAARPETSSAAGRRAR